MNTEAGMKTDTFWTHHEIKRFRIGRTQVQIDIFNFSFIGFKYIFLRGWKIANVIHLDAFHSLDFSIGLFSMTVNITSKDQTVYDHEEDLQ